MAALLFSLDSLVDTLLASKPNFEGRLSNLAGSSRIEPDREPLDRQTTEIDLLCIVSEIATNTKASPNSDIAVWSPKIKRKI